MLHDTRRKSEHSVTLWQEFPPLCTRILFVVNTLTVFLSFCYIECNLFAVFINILCDNWGRFCHPSVIYVPVKCPQGGGIWSPERTLVLGIWTTFLPGQGGIWTIIFNKVKCPGGCLGGGDVEALIWPIHKFVENSKPPYIFERFSGCFT